MLRCQAAPQSRAANAEGFSLDLALSAHTLNAIARGGMETESAGRPLCLRGSPLDQKKINKSAPILSIICAHPPPPAALLLIITCNEYGSCGIKKSNFPS